jgi:zinc D-Ala-D-Ala carboxypeptidase
MKDATCSAYAASHNIDNLPNRSEIANMQFLAQTVFEPLRNHFKVPLHIKSFFRSPKLNKAIGEVPNSSHLFGQAIDLEAIASINNKQLFDHIIHHLPFTQLIWEFGDDHNPDWIHVSLARNLIKHQVFRSFRNPNGSITYVDITREYQP